jgi:ATP-dependent RNA helicase DeaD
MSFESFGLPAELLQAVNQLGYTAPTAIQSEAIPVLSHNDTDFVGLAQTGTGKTCAFTLPLLQKIDLDAVYPQAIILLPTRELCQQVTGEVLKLSQFIPDLRVEAIYGGTEMGKQSSALRKGVHIIVATPGRLLDQLGRRNVKLDQIKYIVLDEADKMLEMGFEDDVREIIEKAHDDRKIWLFSATMPKPIRQIADQYMNDPVEVTIGFKNTTAENISHQYYLCRPTDRLEVLQRIIDINTDIYGLIFTRTRSEAQIVAEELIKQGYNADALHGDLPQPQRERVMKMFRERTLQLLVATDVAARGLDVQDVTHVIHFGIPDDIDTYIHRAGRTARAGKSGISVAIVTPGERNRQAQIERLIKRTFEKQEIPSAEQIAEKRMESYVRRLQTFEPDPALIAQYLPIFEQAFENMSKEELIKHLCGQEMSRFWDYYKDARDLNIAQRQPNTRESALDRKGGRNDRRNGREFEPIPGKYTRFFINLGKKDGFDKRGFLDWLSRNTRLPLNHLHRVDLQNSFSFFETYSDEAQIVQRRLADASYHNRTVNLSLADPSNGGSAIGGRQRAPRERGFAFADDYRSNGGGRSTAGGSRPRKRIPGGGRFRNDN